MTEKGGIVLTPPGRRPIVHGPGEDIVTKYHVCVTCSDELTAWLKVPPTLRAKPEVTTHVLYEGRTICGFMKNVDFPKNWPDGHNWVPLSDVVEQDGIFRIPVCTEKIRPCNECLNMIGKTKR
jgi:hypothetical protein